jgi:hypothetical protein
MTVSSKNPTKKTCQNKSTCEVRLKTHKNTKLWLFTRLNCYSRNNYVSFLCCYFVRVSFFNVIFLMLFFNTCHRINLNHVLSVWFFEFFFFFEGRVGVGGGFSMFSKKIYFFSNFDISFDVFLINLKISKNIEKKIKKNKNSMFF